VASRTSASDSRADSESDLVSQAYASAASETLDEPEVT